MTREQRVVFGEVAEQYDAARPSYPDEIFDLVFEYGGFDAGARALEIGAGTGRATKKFAAHGLQVHALEPSPGMSAVLRGRGFDVEESTFEDYAGPGEFALVYGAQSWHWVYAPDRYERLARVLQPAGVVALFWNHGRPHPEPFKTDNDAVYARLWPENDVEDESWPPSETPAELNASGLFEAIESHVVTWETEYTSDEWVRLLQTHSSHRMLPDDLRTEVHEGVRVAIDKHGGTLPCTYDTDLYLARLPVRR